MKNSALRKELVELQKKKTDIEMLKDTILEIEKNMLDFQKKPKS